MTTLWSDTLLLTALGMGTVFVFLLLLIAALTIMSSVVKRFETTTDDTQVRLDIAAAALAAYRQHNK